VDNSGSVNTSGRRSATVPGASRRGVGPRGRACPGDAAGSVVLLVSSESLFAEGGVATVGLLASFRPDVATAGARRNRALRRLLSSLTSPAEPVAITEALALAYLAGWALSTLRERAHDGRASPGLLLGMGSRRLSQHRCLSTSASCAIGRTTGSLLSGNCLPISAGTI